MCFQVEESNTHWISRSKLAPFLCQINNLHLYKGNDHGINGKCQITLHGVHANPTTNLSLLHFGHVMHVSRFPRIAHTHLCMHGLIHGSIQARSLFPFGSSSLHNKTSNSSMKLLLTPWVVFKLSNINKADNMEVEDPLDNGVEAFSNNISMNDP